MGHQIFFFGSAPRGKRVNAPGWAPEGVHGGKLDGFTSFYYFSHSLDEGSNPSGRFARPFVAQRESIKKSGNIFCRSKIIYLWSIRLNQARTRHSQCRNIGSNPVWITKKQTASRVYFFIFLQVEEDGGSNPPGVTIWPRSSIGRAPKK